MIWFSTIWHVPANTKTEMIYDSFIFVFGANNIRIPTGGIMPTSVTLGGRSIVNCLLKYDLDSAVDIVGNAGRNWDVWGWQTMDGKKIMVPVKPAVKPFMMNGSFDDLHRYAGQAEWVTA